MVILMSTNASICKNASVKQESCKGLNDQDAVTAEDGHVAENPRILLRVARYDDDGQFRQGELLTLEHICTEGLPNSVKFISPGMYVIPESEWRERAVGVTKEPEGTVSYRLLTRSEGITELQQKCEKEDRVLYSVVAESDALKDEDGELAIDSNADFWHVVAWVMRFAEWLGIDNYVLYFSGNRSIHLHADAFVVGQRGLKWLKRKQEEFCEETGADLDVGIQQPKGQFRCPGAPHRASDGHYRKVKIEPDDTYSEVVSKSGKCDVSPHLPDPIVDSNPVIESVSQVFQDQEVDPDVESRLLSPKPNIDAFESEKSPHEDDIQLYKPYMCAGGGNQTRGPSRSICIAKQIGKDLIHDSSRNKWYLKADILHALGARGCGNGVGFTTFGEHWLELSPKDKKKWEFQPGDTFAMLSGRSGSSKLIDLTGKEREQDQLVAALKDGGRKNVIWMLELLDYDTGSDGHDGEYESEYEGSSDTKCKGQRKKEQIEKGEIGLRPDAVRDAARYITWSAGSRTGLEGPMAAARWCRRQFDNEFSVKITYKQICSIVDFVNKEYERYNLDKPTHADILELKDLKDRQQYQSSANGC